MKIIDECGDVTPEVWVSDNEPFCAKGGKHDFDEAVCHRRLTPQGEVETVTHRCKKCGLVRGIADFV